MDNISLTSMTKIQLTPEDLEAFYNKCHGEDGRFCEEDGVVSGKSEDEGEDEDEDEGFYRRANEMRINITDRIGAAKEKLNAFPSGGHIKSMERMLAEEELEEAENDLKSLEAQIEHKKTGKPSFYSSQDLLSLTIIEDEGAHYHQDPETQFYNKCHSEEDGKFCSGPGVISGRTTLRDSDGDVIKPNEVPEKRGRLGASLVDPHEGTLTIDGVRGYDKKTKKPVPGTDAYLEAHNISRKDWNARPYIKYEASKTDPALDQAFPKGKYFKDKGRKLFMGTAEDTDPYPTQTGGYIMYKHPVPGSEHGPIAPQVRPNVPVVTDKGKRARALAILKDSETRLDTLKKMKPEVLVKERRVEAQKAKYELERVSKSTVEDFKAEARKELEIAQAKKEKILASTDDPHERKAAQTEFAREKKAYNKIVGTKDKPGKADKPNYKEGEVENARLRYEFAQKSLENAKKDPEGALIKEIKRQGGPDGTGIRTETHSGGRVGKNRKAFEETAAKYLFTPGVTSARIDMSQDKQNVKNLVEGKGRIYLAMEGSIKNDAILSAIRKEDPTATVVNVPSVTLWQQNPKSKVVENPDLPAEIGWFARTYAKDRDVILIPDADGVKNTNVMLQAKALKASLLQNDAGQVYISTPPLKPNSKKVDKFNLPSGAEEERKGIDDHLGAGRGNLGQLRYETFEDYPEYDLSHHTVAKGATGKDKLSAGAIKNAQLILGAISNIVEDKGIGVVPLKTLNQTAGFRPKQKTSAREAMKHLERIGIIRVERVFDEKAAGRGERVPNPDMSEDRRDQLVTMGVIKEPHFYRKFREVNIDISPVISILKPEYILKADHKSHGVLSDLPDWNPPANYKGWTSAVTEKPDNTGIAKTMEERHNKFLQKTAAKQKFEEGLTAKERLALKKAPPGRRLVRTREGAKKYGVNIGEPIPLAKGPKKKSSFALTNMVLLSSIMTEEELVAFYNRYSEEEEDTSLYNLGEGDIVTSFYTKNPGEGDTVTSFYTKNPGEGDTVTSFYNKCHGDDGRFCEGESGGPVSGKFGFGNKNIRTIDKTLVGSVEVDGIKAKAVYEIDTDDGQGIRLYDKVGNVDSYKDELLESQAQMHNLYPLHPPRNIIVTKPDGLFRDTEIDEGTFAIVHGNSPNTYVNADMLGTDVGRYKDGFQMPSAKVGDTDNMDYLLTHEYGHHLDFDRHSKGGYSYQEHPMYDNPAFQESLSTYGLSDPRGVEAYAETFAEWHHSGGQTTNPAAIAMARYEGWAGVNEPWAEASGSNTVSLNASIPVKQLEAKSNGSETISLVLQNPIHFSKNSIKKFPEDTEEDINADIPKLGGKGISVIDSVNGSKVVGDFEVKKPSKEEIARADKIIREVYEELRLNFPEEVS